MRILFSFLLLLTSINAFAQYSTPGTGVNWNMDSLVLYSNGTVTGIDDIYEINYELSLSENDTLIISSAEIITIDTDVNVYFSGYFMANNPTGLLITPYIDATFGGLRFEEESSAILKHVTIQYGGGIKVITPNFEMDSCTVYYLDFSFNTGAALEISNGKPVIRNSSFISNARAAISSAANAEVAPIIENNTFLNNNTSNSNRPQINLGPSGATDTTKIIGNQISGSPDYEQAGGIAFSSLLGIDGNVMIKDNEVVNNRYGIAIIGNGINALIKDNICANNNTQDDPLLGGSGINFNASSTSTAIVSGNEIYGNLWGITVQGEFEINMGDETEESPGENIFYQNGNNDEIYALYNNTPNPISALNNCWDGLQSITLEDAEDVIFHEEDDLTLGLVSFDPMWNCGADVGIDEMGNNAFSIYPNPANNELFIESNSNWKEYAIYTISGRLVHSSNFSSESPTRLSVSNLQTGMYILELVSEGEIMRKRFQKM